MIVDVLPSDGFKAFIHHKPKMVLSVELDGLVITRWVFNMLLGSPTQTWMQRIKNRKPEKREHRNSGFFFLPSDGFKAFIHHKPIMVLSVELDGLAITRWVFNMLLGSSNKTWMQIIKNRKLKHWVFNMLLGSSNQTWMQNIENRTLKSKIHHNSGCFTVWRLQSLDPPYAKNGPFSWTWWSRHYPLSF